MLEDGKPQKISVFEFQKLGMEPAPPEPPPTLDDSECLPEPPKTIITTEEPGKVQYHDKRLMVLFFDFSSMGIPEQLRAQEAALKFIDTEMSTADMVAIMLYSTVLQVKTDFTADRTQLKDIINSLPIGEMSELADACRHGHRRRRRHRRGVRRRRDRVQHLQYRPQAGGHRGCVDANCRRCRRRRLSFISRAASARTGVDNQAQLEASINAAAKANVAIYPIDARGLMADPPGGGASKAASRGTGIFTGSVYNSQRATINDSQETLATLAADTGGKAFLDSNELSLGIVQAQQEYRSYYVLGYYSTNLAMDGKYRKITVKLNNNQSAKLEFRQGYYADKVWGKFNGQDKEQQLKEAMNAGDPVTDIPLAVEVGLFPHLADGVLRSGFGEGPGIGDRRWPRRRRRRDASSTFWARSWTTAK